MAGKVKYAQFLYDASELAFTEGGVKHFSEGVAKAEGLLVRLSENASSKDNLQKKQA
jgi:hypothetical protein